MHVLNSILFCSALVAAAPTSQQLSSRAILDTSLPRMSDTDVFKIYKKCWNGALVWPQNDLPPPIKDQKSKQLSIYTIPDTKPGILTVNNYCDYPLHYVHLGGAGGQGVLAAKDTFETPLTGTVFKASKSANLEKVVLAEYNVDAKTGQLWYNWSLIECLGVTNGQKNSDTSLCAGFEAGLQLGNKQHFSYQCKPGTWCDDQAYFYQENECKTENPVTTCNPSLGITAEFCAANKKK